MSSPEMWAKARIPVTRKPVAARPETIRWTLTKNGRTATAGTRQHPKGCELVFRVNGKLLWSEAYADGDPALEQMIQDKRNDFETRGWR